MWLKGRAASEKDAYFAEMVAVFEDAFLKEIRISPHGRSKAPMSHTIHLALTRVYYFLGSGTVPCFSRYCRVVAAMTVKALLGSSAATPETIDLLCRYAEAVPRDGFLIATFPKVLRP